MPDGITLVDKLAVLVEHGVYKDQEALVQDALRALLRSKPLLRERLAIALYQQGEVSLARAAEISGVDIESFKELLREAGVARRVPPAGEAVQHEVQRLMRARETA